MTKREVSDNINLFDEDDLLDLPLKTHPENAAEQDAAAATRPGASRVVQVEAAGPLESLPALDAEQSPASQPPSSSSSAGQMLDNLELFDATAQPAGEAGANTLRGSDAERAVFGSAAKERRREAGAAFLRVEAPTVEEKIRGPVRLSVGSPRFTILHRVLAGALDAAIHVGVALFVFLMVVGEATPADRQLLPGFAVFVLAFSFLYFVLSLLTWGRTPGMVWAGIESCDKNGHGLTFGQAVLRWLGVVMTVGLAGLPFLLALLGRSAADILSGTVTRFSESSQR